MITLNQLLTVDEQIKLLKMPDLAYFATTNKESFELQPKVFSFKQLLDTEIKHITVEQLSHMALMLIATEYNLGDNDKVPECVLSAKAIEILTNRAQKLNLPIF